MNLPSNIHDGEIIIRAVTSPYNMNKKKTRPIAKAFVPPCESAELSVIRLDMGAGSCLKKARKIASREGCEFAGVLNGEAAFARELDLDVEDQREGQFVGHAGIIFRGIREPLLARKKGDTLPPEVKIELDRLTNALLNAFTYISNPIAKDGALVSP